MLLSAAEPHPLGNHRGHSLVVSEWLSGHCHDPASERWLAWVGIAGEMVKCKSQGGKRPSRPRHLCGGTAHGESIPEELLLVCR